MALLVTILFYAVLLILLCVLGAIGYQQYLIRFHQYRFSDGKPLPGPKPDFLFGNYLQVRKLGGLELALHSWRLTYGDAFQFWMFLRPLCFIHDMDAIKFVSSSKDFLGRGQTPASLAAFENKGIINSNDIEHHKIHRSVVLKGLMKTSYLKGVAETVSQMTTKQIQAWEFQRNGHKAVEVPAYSSLSALTLDIISMAAFTTDMKAIDGHGHAYQAALSNLLDGFITFARVPVIAKYFFYSKWKKFMDAKRQLRVISSELVQQRRASEHQEFNDFLAMLLSEIDPRTGQGFTEDVIHFDIADLLAAGHETTSNTVAFSLYLLASHPEVQQRLQVEADKFSDQPSYDDSGRMEIAQAIVKETLRLYAVVPILIRRVATSSQIKLSDGRSIKVEDNDKVIFSMYCLGRDERFFENPEKFNIDRWNHKEEESTNSAWIPFGIGARSCVGARMAMMEAKILLCMIAQKYDVRLHPDMGPLQIKTTITRSPINARLLFYPRSQTEQSIRS